VRPYCEVERSPHDGPSDDADTVGGSCRVARVASPNLRGNQEGGYVATQSGWLWVVDSDNFGADGRVLLVDPAARRVQGQYPSVGFVSADGQRLVVLNGDGRLTKAGSGLRVLERGAVDQQSRGIEPSGPVRVPEGVRPAATDPRDWLAGKRIRQHPAMLSTDGTRVYLGVGRRGPHGGGVWLDEIVIADAATLAWIGSIAPRLPFFSFRVDRGGSRLFTVATPSAEILVLDVTNGNEVASIPVGRTPVFAVQAP